MKNQSTADRNGGRHFDLVIVGAGSGGFAAALSAARLGVKTLLIEKGDSLGGTASRGGVNNWEPGVGGTGIPFELYKRLKKIPDAIGIYSFKLDWPDSPPKFHGSMQLIDSTKCYFDTLQRCEILVEPEEDGRFRYDLLHGVPYEPGIYSEEMEKMLAETGICTVWKNTAFVDCEIQNDRIVSLALDNGVTVSAPIFVDATAHVVLARRCGCEVTSGQDSHARYQEPGAPLEANELLNGTTLVYRVTRKDLPGVDALPSDIPATCWWDHGFPRAFCTQYPNGDFNINSTPTMAGQETLKLGYAAAYSECQKRILAHWHNFQRNHEEFQSYKISWVAPALGIREGVRIIGRYVLTEHDLFDGISEQSHEDIIAIADHPKDTHGEDTGRGWHGKSRITASGNDKEMREPYGIPFRCLLPNQIENLAVCSRGASFSSIAASSCRLSRTMMQLGQAAGVAAKLALGRGCDLAEVSPKDLRSELSAQHVELSWPRSAEFTAFLADE